MQHDQHFLTRLERLEREHTEIALGLYYDSALVRTILWAANIPDEVERVALCLGAPDLGPHVIVTRDGHFVTCLSEGMQLRADQVVVSRHALDGISQEVGSLRSLVADAKAGGSRQSLRKLTRVFEAGPGLSQEEFEDVARWLPLMGSEFIRLHVSANVRQLELLDRLSRVKHWNQRYDELLHDYWLKSWATAHLTLLLGADGGKRMRGLFEAAEQVTPGIAQQMTWGMVRSGVSPFALRGVWLASKLPGWVVPVAKRRYLDPRGTFLTTLTDGLSLIAISLRHRKYHGEVAKTLALRPNLIDKERGLAGVIRGHCAHVFEMFDGEDLAGYREVLLNSARSLGRTASWDLDPNLQDMIAMMSDDDAMAMFMLAPHPIERDNPDSQNDLFMRLAWVVAAEAKSFYLPEQYARIFRGPFTREEGLVLLDPRIALGVGRQKPIVAPPKIGRNQPCPCGSGTKFKRCCGAGPDEIKEPYNPWLPS